VAPECFIVLQWLDFVNVLVSSERCCSVHCILVPSISVISTRLSGFSSVLLLYLLLVAGLAYGSGTGNGVGHVNKVRICRFLVCHPGIYPGNLAWLFCMGRCNEYWLFFATAGEETASSVLHWVLLPGLVAKLVVSSSSSSQKSYSDSSAALFVSQSLSERTPSYLADDCCLVTNANSERLHLAETRMSVRRTPTLATELSVQLDRRV